LLSSLSHSLVETTQQTRWAIEYRSTLVKLHEWSQ
jgi:hypothetical protein